MTDPPRLLDGPLSSVERDLLASARLEEPSDSATKLMLTGLSAGAVAGVLGAGAAVGSGSSLGSAGATASLHPAAPVALWTVTAKWIGGFALLGAFGGGIWWGVSKGEAAESPERDQAASSALRNTLVERSGSNERSGAVDQHAAERTSATDAAATDVAATDGESLGQIAGELSTRRTAGPAVNSASSAKAPTEPSKLVGRASTTEGRSTTVTQEVIALGGVRNSLNAGNAQAALEQLARYRSRFPRGVLSPEATVLEQRAKRLLSPSTRTDSPPAE